MKVAVVMIVVTLLCACQAYSQEMLIHMKNGKTAKYQLSEIDSVTYSSARHPAHRDAIAVNRDAVITDLAMLGADAYQYHIRPVTLGGGNGTYAGYVILPTGQWGEPNPNATYVITNQTANQLVLTATSKVVKGATVVVSYDGEGRVTSGPTANGF